MLLLSDQELLIDKFPHTDPHNVGARILRLGLSVTAFASLERYIEGCIQKLATDLAACHFPYAQFPAALREFLTINAIAGLVTRGNFVPTSDRLLYIETHLANLAKYGDTPPIYTSLGFSPRGSNVNSDDISVAFKALLVKKPWDIIASISALSGNSFLDIQNDFRSLAKTRHRSAHDPLFTLPSADLKRNIRTAISIGLSIDVLTKSLSTLWTNSPGLAEVEAGVVALAFPMRFLDDQPGDIVVERAAQTSTIIKKYANEELAFNGAGSRATKAYIIRRDTSGLPLALADAAVGPAAF